MCCPLTIPDFGFLLKTTKEYRGQFQIRSFCQSEPKRYRGQFQVLDFCEEKSTRYRGKFQILPKRIDELQMTILHQGFLPKRIKEVQRTIPDPAKENRRGVEDYSRSGFGRPSIPLSFYPSILLTSHINPPPIPLTPSSLPGDSLHIGNTPPPHPPYLPQSFPPTCFVQGR